MTNLSFHKLTDAEVHLLSRGLTFCLEANFDLFEAITDLHLFARKILLKVFYAKKESEVDTTDWSVFSMKEFKALRDLTLLYEEGNTTDLIDQIDLNQIFEKLDKPTINPLVAFRKASTKFPSMNSNPNVSMVLNQTIRDLCKLPQKTTNTTNLTADEIKAISTLQKNKSIIIKASDKGGNVVVMNSSH